jgi:xanthine dehydrogenase YagS FAD-binding subunit
MHQLFAELARPGRRARIVAGGTDMLVGIRQAIYDPEVLVDVTAIAAMRGVSVHDGFIRLGGATPLADVERDDHVRRHFPALVECLGMLATPLVREAATVAGDLSQEKRCWFFRSRFPCYKLGGATCPCFAVLGDNRHHSILDAKRCAAPCPADLAPMLSALDARVAVASPRGVRTIGMDDLYRWSGLTCLEADEAIVHLDIPILRNATAAFEKFAIRKGDFAEASVAVRLAWDGHRVAEARLSVGSVAPFPARIRASERALQGSRPGGARIREAAEMTVHGSLPLSRNGFKTHLLVTLAERAIRRALG